MSAIDHKLLILIHVFQVSLVIEIQPVQLKLNEVAVWHILEIMGH